MDNGSSFIAAAEWIANKWGIKHIRISPYNSQANGSIERPHWDVRQMLYKATGAQNVSKWFWFLDVVLWADRITVQRRTGWSLYYMITGAHPILPLDTEEATWLVKPPNGVINEDELIGMRARSLAKHRIHVKQMRKRIDQDKLRRLKAYEKDYAAVIKDFAFKPGDLVLVRNTEIENSLNKKMKPRYNRPMIVVVENQGKSYIVVEMSGAVWHNKVAKFRVVPYFARRRIEIPEGIQKIIDLHEIGLQKLLSAPEDDNLQGRDYLMDDVKMTDSDDNSDQEEEVDKSDCIQ
jgi:ribosomal protein S17